MKKNNKSPAEHSSLLLDESVSKAPPNFEWIYDWTKQFKDLIEKPINVRESLLQRQQPQKCLQHSIVFSIYCTFCRKILCASCMYSSSIHRKHRIIPIENSGEQLKEDIKSFESRIQKITKQTEGLIRTNSDILLKIDRQFSPLQTQVHKFYERMHNYMKKKQQEQLNQLKQLRDSVRSQIIEYNQKLTRFNAYINSKFQYYSDANVKSTTILASRTILQVLLSSSTLINENISELDKFSFPLNEDKINIVQQEIEAKLGSMMSNFHRPEIRIKNNRVKTQGQQQPSRTTQPRDLTAKKPDNTSPYKDLKRKNSSLAALGRSFKR